MASPNMPPKESWRPTFTPTTLLVLEESVVIVDDVEAVEAVAVVDVVVDTVVRVTLLVVLVVVGEVIVAVVDVVDVPVEDVLHESHSTGHLSLTTARLHLDWRLAIQKTGTSPAPLHATVVVVLVVAVADESVAVTDV